MFVIIEYIFLYAARLQHFVVIPVDTNLAVKWVGLGPWVDFYKMQGAKI
jgi:hypothetical protein